MKLKDLNKILIPMLPVCNVTVTGGWSGKTYCRNYNVEKHSKYADRDVITVYPKIRLDSKGRAVPYLEVIISDKEYDSFAINCNHELH